jgi:hypothetical protein
MQSSSGYMRIMSYHGRAVAQRLDAGFLYSTKVKNSKEDIEHIPPP